jgi:hemoglobin
MQTLFDAVGGIEGLRRLADAWHRRVMADDVVAHAFSHGFHPQHVERLAAYWAEAFGGPTMYSDLYGNESIVVKMHSGNGEHDEMDRRAIACFDQALGDAGLASDDELRQILHDYFAWATPTTMSRYHHSADDVPSGLRHPTLVVGRTPAVSASLAAISALAKAVTRSGSSANLTGSSW